MSELNPELFVVSLVFTFNPQSHADGAGFYDAPCSPHLPSICTCILCAPFVECFKLKAVSEASFFAHREQTLRVVKQGLGHVSDVAELHKTSSSQPGLKSAQICTDVASIICTCTSENKKTLVNRVSELPGTA